MCGIAGAIGAIDAEVEAAVRAMIDAEVHRGPDDSGVYRSDGNPGVVFGFRRLSIIDLSSEGHQPMLDGHSGSALVFNGEIYNYADLRADLAREGGPFRSTGDTEVLLRACVRWGKDALYRLRGMYGFAFFDKQRREVLLARDRMGIKPLYYAEITRPSGKTLLFASELRALLATKLFERHIDPRGLATYLWNGFVVGPSTLVRGISLLPAGHSLTVPLDAPRARLERYWSLVPRATTDEESAVEELQSELETATRQHLVSDVPLGVFLSGGIDSSAVAALAVRAGGSQIKTFHISFDEADFDESVHARKVATALGTEHADFRLTQARFRSELDQALEALDQPTFDAINTYFVSRVVRDAGFKVALAGTGGDELFGGYRTFRDLPRAMAVGRWSKLAPREPVAAMTRMALGLARGSAEVAPQTRWGKLPDVVTAEGDLVDLYQVSYGLFTHEFMSGLADRNIVSLARRGLPKSRSAELRSESARLSPLSGVGLLELSLFIGERLLRDTDAASMAVSLEVRVPLLDHRVVEAAQTIADSRRFLPLGRKLLLRSLAMPDLDPEIFERPKAGFVLPIELWAKDLLAGDIESTFADRGLVSSLGLRSDSLGRLWNAFRAGSPGLYWSRLWAPYVLLNWCKRHRLALA
jgi:asparagine synthase (glutamine-hydrolysing)